MPFFRGQRLAIAQLILIVAPSFILFGYNQAGVGGLLSVRARQSVYRDAEIDTF
jgi:uncharacterized linocin/CFP29 family protein